MPNPKLETYKNKATGTVYDYTDAAAQAALADILDGTDIDSFGDVETALDGKVDEVSGKGLSTNDYDDTEKAKVAGAFPRSEQAVLGAKNLLRPTLTTFTTNGVTFTVNEDKTITVNGTATADIYCPVFNREYAPELSQGSYLVSGGVAETTNYKFYLQERNAANTDWGRAYYDTTGKGVQYDRTTDVRYAVFIWVKSGATLNNVKFYPMITLASDTDRTFAPYAMTNKELTTNSLIYKGVFSNVDVNSFTDKGIYVLNGSLSNNPDGSNYGTMIVFPSAGGGIGQIYYRIQWDVFYTRRYYQGAWSNWYKYAGTELT